MKLGYVGSAHRSLDCRPDRKFRLSSFSEKRFINTVTSNLDCLEKTLKFNVDKGLLFYRIADFIPFASHPICTVDWLAAFKQQFERIGDYIKDNGLRIAMHPGQYALINSPEQKVVEGGIWEIEVNCTILDALELDKKSKVQIHVGGTYGNKSEAIKRFITKYDGLPQSIKDRLVIENDDRGYSFQDCLKINESTDIPVVLDVFHHGIYNNGETTIEIIKLAIETWKKEDGPLMVDYSDQEPDRRTGRHAETLNVLSFKKFLEMTGKWDFDIMLELKDKEKSALQALDILKKQKGAIT